MKIYNETLKKLHEGKRKGTIEQIKSAVETIRAWEGENANINTKKLMQFTNLSRSALYKEHALKIWHPELWEERHVKRSKVKLKLEGKCQTDIKVLNEEIANLKNQLDKTTKKIKILEKSLGDEKKRTDVYKLDIDELRTKNQKLLGEGQRLQNLAYINGIGGKKSLNFHIKVFLHKENLE